MNRTQRIITIPKVHSHSSIGSPGPIRKSQSNQSNKSQGSQESLSRATKLKNDPGAAGMKEHLRRHHSEDFQYVETNNGFGRSTRTNGREVSMSSRDFMDEAKFEPRDNAQAYRRDDIRLNTPKIDHQPSTETNRKVTWMPISDEATVDSTGRFSPQARGRKALMLRKIDQSSNTEANERETSMANLTDEATDNTQTSGWEILTPDGDFADEPTVDNSNSAQVTGRETLMLSKVDKSLRTEASDGNVLMLNCDYYEQAIDRMSSSEAKRVTWMPRNGPMEESIIDNCNGRHASGRGSLMLDTQSSGREMLMSDLMDKATLDRSDNAWASDKDTLTLPKIDQRASTEANETLMLHCDVTNLLPEGTCLLTRPSHRDDENNPPRFDHESGKGTRKSNLMQDINSTSTVSVQAEGEENPVLPPDPEIINPGDNLIDLANNLNDPVANPNDPAANLNDPAANLNNPAANLNDPAANLNNPAANLNNPAASLNDPANNPNNLGPNVDAGDATPKPNKAAGQEEMCFAWSTISLILICLLFSTVLNFSLCVGTSRGNLPPHLYVLTVFLETVNLQEYLPNPTWANIESRLRQCANPDVLCPWPLCQIADWTKDFVNPETPKYEWQPWN